MTKRQLRKGLIVQMPTGRMGIVVDYARKSGMVLVRYMTENGRRQRLVTYKKLLLCSTPLNYKES